MSVGKKMKEIRERKGLSQAECARRGEVSEKTWMRWEQGKPPRYAIPAIALALDVPIWQVKDEPPPAEDEGAFQALRAVASVYSLTETAIPEQERQRMRRAFESYVRLLDAVLGGETVEKSAQQEAVQALAEIMRKVEMKMSQKKEKNRT